MHSRIVIDMLPQPDETTCGPTCLHAVYQYYNHNVELDEIISQVQSFQEGGTLAVMLGIHALKRGFQVTIYTYNLQIFDPSWFQNNVDLSRKLKEQAEFKKTRNKLQIASTAYMEFLKMGGKIKYQTLNPDLIRKYLKKEIPILTGLSSTYLYNTPREYGPDSDYDDIRGEPGGHFVVLSGYDATEKKILVADPFPKNPLSPTLYYDVDMNRLINGILLGILTYDANLLIIEKKTHRDSP